MRNSRLGTGFPPETRSSLLYRDNVSMKIHGLSIYRADVIKIGKHWLVYLKPESFTNFGRNKR